MEIKDLQKKENEISLGALGMGVQQVGGGITEETDPTVPQWAKQPNKPEYDYSEIKSTPDLTVYAKKTEVKKEISDLVNSAPETLDTLGEIAKALQDNEEVVDLLNQAIGAKASQTDLEEVRNTANANAQAISELPTEADVETAKTEAKDWGTAEATAMLGEAKSYTNQKFNGANKAVAFTNYSALCTALNNDNQVPQYIVGQNIYIQTLNVPDLWVRNISEMYNYYIYNTDEDFINKLNEKGYVQVGFYLLSALETQKVDLTEYSKTEYVDEKVTEANAYTDERVNLAYVTIERAANDYTDEKIGDISTALDELHTYAQSLINGGGSQ